MQVLTISIWEWSAEDSHDGGEVEKKNELHFDVDVTDDTDE
jgi:hypothetical protein